LFEIQSWTLLTAQNSDISLPEKVNKSDLPYQISRTTYLTTGKTGSKLPNISQKLQGNRFGPPLKIEDMKINKQDEKQYHIKDSLKRTLLVKMKIAKSMKTLIMSSICTYDSLLSEEWR
jgi:hypothetical protein